MTVAKRKPPAYRRRQITINEFISCAERKEEPRQAPWRPVRPEKVEGVLLANIRANQDRPSGATFANCAALDGVSYGDCMRALVRLRDTGAIRWEIVGRVCRYVIVDHGAGGRPYETAAHASAI